jgi:caffeoyl-CoA O-methyltransferase
VDIVKPAVEEYLHHMQEPPTKLLKDMGASGIKRGFPIIGPLVGRVCEQLARGIGAKTVFEMGSGFGYSTAWFARAVGPKGRVVHTEMDAAKAKEAQNWLSKEGLEKCVEFRTGDALEVLREDAGSYDVIFIDIDKEGYPDAWHLACKRVRVGGLIITDNTLWSGKVTKAPKDAATKGVVEYNRLAFGDANFLTTLLPIRDGVAVSLRLQ